MKKEKKKFHFSQPNSAGLVIGPPRIQKPTTKSPSQPQPPSSSPKDQNPPPRVFATTDRRRWPISGEAMASEEDHYKVLGLPSGEDGMKLGEKEIQSAYRAMARVIHPDKNPNDPLAKSRFQQLQASFDVLRDAAARKAFDDLLRARIGRARREAGRDSKRRRMVSDLEERERAAAAGDSTEDQLRAEEERAARVFREEVARLRAMAAMKQAAPAPAVQKVPTPAAAAAAGEEKILKVSWGRGGVDYTPARLRELFGEFGEVDDVVILEKKKAKKRSALVVMASKETAVSF